MGRDERVFKSMDEVRLAVLGAGSVRLTPYVIGGLATYFGERRLDIAFWDADEERLDLFDRFARLCFSANENEHGLRSSSDAREMMEDADILLFQVGPNCARKHIRQTRAHTELEDDSVAIQESVKLLCAQTPRDSLVLSLMGDELELPLETYYRLDWPPEMSEAEHASWPLQILRYLNGEEYLHDFFRAHATSPLKKWLDDPTLATSLHGSDRASDL